MKRAVLRLGSDTKDSDWPLSEKERGRAGGMAHVCPVSEDDKMAAAKADLSREEQTPCEERQTHYMRLATGHYLEPFFMFGTI